MLCGLISGAILLGSIPFSTAAEEGFSITISMEGNTLGQGMYVEPVTYTLDEINSLIATEGYDPCTEETLTAGLVTLAMFIDKGLEYEITGSWDSTAYVAKVKGLDKGYLDIPAVITENGGPSNAENDGNDDEYLGEFDYGSMSGWMLCVDSHFIGVSCAAYNAAEAAAEGATFESGSVIRWQFTLYGYGADLGTPMMMGTTYIEAANKDALYRKYAELSASGFFDDNAQAKADALAVMENLTATQDEADNALEALVEASSGSSEPAGNKDISAELNAVLGKLAADVTEPSFGTTAGEWTILTLARGGYYQPDDKYFKDYYDRIVETVNTTASSVNLGGALHKVKSTENSRLIMALSAIGRDARKVGDWNLVEAYSTNGFSWIKKQGINGPVFALIALDTRGYETTDTTLRKQCVDYLLEKQLSDGGWALSGSSADPDMTAMTLQALAKYTSDPVVATACMNGFTALSNIQQDDGGYKSWGSVNSESIAQVVVACTAHGVNPHTDARFVKNGKSVVDALMTFYNADTKNFSHVIGDGGNAMATDQASYALAAYSRFAAGKTSLYDMTDVPSQDGEPVSDKLEAVLTLPAEVSGKKDTSFNAIVGINGWKNDAGYKLMDCIVTVPEQLDVASVTMGEGVSGGQLSYNLERSTGKLRVVYFDPQGSDSLKISGTDFPAELFTVKFRVNTNIDSSKIPYFDIAVTGMSLKFSSDPSEEGSMSIVDTSKAYGSVSVEDGISFSAICLYKGDGVDLIPESKMAVAISVTNLDDPRELIFNGAAGSVNFLYSPAISSKTGVLCYTAVVDSSISLGEFVNADNYTVAEAANAQSVIFGDVTGDGTINAQDALASVDLWLRKSGDPDNGKILRANVNGDSRINTYDALGIVETFVNGTTCKVVNKAVMLGGNG